MFPLSLYAWCSSTCLSNDLIWNTEYELQSLAIESLWVRQNSAQSWVVGIFLLSGHSFIWVQMYVHRHASSKLYESHTMISHKTFYTKQCTHNPATLSQSQNVTSAFITTTQVPCIRLRHHFQILYACTKMIMWQHIYDLEQPQLNAVRTVWPLFQEASGYWKRT